MTKHDRTTGARLIERLLKPGFLGLRIDIFPGKYDDKKCTSLQGMAVPAEADRKLSFRETGVLKSH